jgi:NAD+ synthase (glutamine-hydrolysing)
MTGKLKIVMAQINLLVGAIQSNTDQVLAAANQAIETHDADLIAFPELTLTGYPPEDLLLRPSIKPRIDNALQQIIDANLDIYLVVGYPHKQGDKLFNALSIIKCGEVLATYHKQSLPNYQVFDENRYFEKGSQSCLLNIKGIPIAFTICEDMWEEQPTLGAAEAGAKLMININASPYHMNKMQQRRELLKERSCAGGMPIVYTNLVGGQDELVFDGASMVVDATGECKYQAPAFAAGLFLVEIEHSVAEETVDKGSETGEVIVSVPPQEMAKPTLLEADVYQALILGVRDYVNKNHFKGVVIGLSGGIDSALTLAVAVDALGADRVRAVMMPFEYTSDLSKSAARKQATTQGVGYEVIPISTMVESTLAALQEEFEGLPLDVTEQNIQARCRGMLLMAISNKKGLMVLTTGNKSEIAVGYSTLYGDMAGGFNVLKDVSKTLVYRLAKFRNEKFEEGYRQVIPQVVIDRPPSAELAPGQLDEDSLPPYDELDQILELYVERDYSAEAIVAEGFREETVKKVLRLVDLNEYKRRQSPVGVRLTQRGFGRDRRYPITNAWELGK